ncbi:App1 family protein [Ulvibacterium sp.]|uniref:App1 family protein n=1 Tax=Ulvibacterium sp. TaxID=2665914 RepID=UPI002611BA17|nr:phosphatase domain-containing protein [Ulvibacterium sp.]
MALFSKKDKLQIIAFQTYGTNEHLYARGRALEDEQIDLSEKGFLSLLRNTYKRFETDEIRNTSITLTLPDQRTVSWQTDNEGYYLIDESFENLGNLTNDEGWLKYRISYSDTNLKREILHQNQFPGEVLIPSQDADFGVVSDIDDTILHTGVVSSLKWRVILNTVFRNAVHRKPLEGTADFYNLLHTGASGQKANPIFYVSHSPWNLYRYLELFLRTNNFPKGPIILRRMSSFNLNKSKAGKPQKQKEIANILETYPNLPFILIGDSGERDADIYINIAKRYPNRIAAIYLQSVPDRKRMLRVNELLEKFRATPTLVVRKSEEAITHARKNGFIQ